MRPLRLAVSITLVLGTVVGSSVAALGQPREKVSRIAVLDPGRPPGGRCVPSFRQGLRDLGYIEGQTIVVDVRYAEEDPSRIAGVAADLVRQAPDVFWTHSPEGARAAKQATSTIPIVVGVAGYLVEQGLAASLGRPGGNVTGFELGDIELGGKRLQLLKEAVPSVAHVAVLVDPSMRPYDGVPRHIEPEARRLGVRVQRFEARNPESFESVFVAMVKARADAVMIADLPVFVRHSPRLFELALRHRLPTISGWRRYAEAGSLIGYGANVPDVCRRSATYVDKILKGARPADLPIERPAKLELVINLKTAKALALTMPPAILIRADDIIQ